MYSVQSRPGRDFSVRRDSSLEIQGSLDQLGAITVMLHWLDLESFSSTLRISAIGVNAYADVLLQLIIIAIHPPRAVGSWLFFLLAKRSISGITSLLKIVLQTVGFRCYSTNDPRTLEGPRLVVPLLERESGLPICCLLPGDEPL